MLRGDDGEFWLEPVAVSPEEEQVRLEVRLADAGAEGRTTAGLYRNSMLGRPHLVFRRSVEQPQLEIGAAGRTRRRRKKKRKLERNCGTRGENPPTPFSPSTSSAQPFIASLLLVSRDSFSSSFFPFLFFPLSSILPSLGFFARLLSILDFFLFRQGPGRKATISRARLSDSFFSCSTCRTVRSHADKILRNFNAKEKNFRYNDEIYYRLRVKGN